MKFSRRDVIKGMGAAGLTPLLVSSCGGDSGSDLPPLPELPEYEFSGTPGPATMFEHGVASGDPLTDAVILWTRVSPEGDGEIEAGPAFLQGHVERAHESRPAACRRARALNHSEIATAAKAMIVEITARRSAAASPSGDCSAE